jgi:L-threonylcarbamoyladenylate synthase
LTRVHEVDPRRPVAARAALDEAAAAILAGSLVVLPTETVYGIAARPDDAAATEQVFQAKRRPASLSLPVLAPDAETAWTLGRRTPGGGLLARAYWPGPLTMVLERTLRTAAWGLGQHGDSIAVRVPHHAVASGLMALAGPIAATSANLSGQPPVEDLEGLVSSFGDAVAVFLVVPPGLRPRGTPSTVVDVRGGGARVLREGALAGAEVAAVASGRQG